MASPFVFDVSALLREGAQPETQTRRGAAPRRIGAEMIAIPEGEEVEVSAVLSPVGSGVLVDADLTATLKGECSRCLAELNWERSYHVSEMFLGPGESLGGDEADDEADEPPEVVDDEVDITQAVTDEVGLDLPFNPVCEGGCEGEAPAPDGISGEDEGELIDPRLADLEKFL